jgi:hypothetical protein
LTDDPSIRVAGIDQSRNGFGWAVGSDDPAVKPVWGTVSYAAAGRNEGLMFHLVRKTMNEIIDRGVDKVFFEQPLKLPHDRLEGDLITIGIPAIIMLTCYERDIPYAWCKVDDWRSYFLGTKKAPPGLTNGDARRKWFKETAMSECLQRGWLVEDHNAAEALGIMTFGLAALSRRFRSREAFQTRKAEGRRTRLL